MALRVIEGGKMRRTTLTALVSFGLGAVLFGGIAAVQAGGGSVTAGLPTALGSAKKGTLHATDLVNLNAKSVAMLGGWRNAAVPCSSHRRLRISVLVHRTGPGGTGTTVRRSRTGVIQNCAEGGPNFGFELTADSLGMACPDGAWRPGRYDFVIHTDVALAKLRATAALTWPNRVAC